MASTRVGLGMMTRMFRRLMRHAGPHVLRTAERISPWNPAKYPFFGGILVSNPNLHYLPSWVPTWNGRHNFSYLKEPTMSLELKLWDISHTCIRYRIVVLPAESSPSIKIRTSFSFQPASEVRDANNELKLIPILYNIIVVLFSQVRRSRGPRWWPKA